MKRFRYKHNIAIYLILTAVLAVTVAGMVNSVISLMKEGLEPIKMFSQITLCIINALLFSFALSVIIASGYSFKKSKLVLRFGFLTFKTPLDQVISVCKMTSINKLVLYFKGEKYSVIVINSKYYDDFIGKLKHFCPKIEYFVNSDEKN